jgi:hypothetical protein
MSRLWRRVGGYNIRLERNSIEDLGEKLMDIRLEWNAIQLRILEK